VVAGDRGAQSGSANTPSRFGVTTGQIAEQLGASAFLEQNPQRLAEIFDGARATSASINRRIIGQSLSR
jgi:hypothetical protein